MATSRSPPGIASGLNSTALTSVKTMVFKPMPSANVTMMANENQGWEAIIRTEYFKSRIMEVGTRFTLGLFPSFIAPFTIHADGSGFCQTSVPILPGHQRVTYLSALLGT